ncbi:MAG: transcription-repair coupling factor [Armatimonadota bacterium]
MNWILSALTEEWADLPKIQEGLSESASLVRVDGATDPVKALVVAALLHTTRRPILVICPTSEDADRVHDHIVALVDGDSHPDTPTSAGSVVPLPSLEGLLYEDVIPDPTLVGERLRALMMLRRGEPRIYVASAPAAFQRCLPPEVLEPAALTLRRGAEVDREALVARLVELGYQREQMVDGPGQFSARGGVLDVFPSGSRDPLRAELFGDEVESLRWFDPNSQRSVAELDTFTILPAREVLLTSDVLQRAIPLFRQAGQKQSEQLRAEGKEPEADRLQSRLQELLAALEQQAYPRGIEYLLPFFYSEPTTALNYLPAEAAVVLDEPHRLSEQYCEFVEDLAGLQQARVGQGLLLPLPGPLHLCHEEARTLVGRRATIEIGLFAAADGRPATRVSISSQPMEEFAADIPHLAVELRRWQQAGNRVLIATRQADRLIELLDEAGIGNMVRESQDIAPKPGQIVISSRPLNEGFKLPAASLIALTDRETFGWRRVRRIIRRRAAEGIPIGSLSDLREGDYVVHINHGVGIYRGMVRRGPQGAEREYLLVEYAEGDRLYVPTEQFDRVQKYLGGEDERPAVHRLGGSEWERAKRRAQRSAREMAAELIRIYAARHNRPGHAFVPDTPWQREMEDGFAYEETPDQLAAVEAVKQDMEQPRPMDRLICGDVGYGKTEVAMRAAFKAVMDGRQVAVLVPTTVLAQQHYTTFKERLNPYPVRIEMLSRFRSRKEQEKVVADLAAGAVDIVIGTHRLLSKDVQFKDLGLVVVDEEQRFGVRHKEKLKQLRAIVDVMTMTATPIPRTLNMALSGIRDMSVINDPPEGRTAVITRTLPREDGLMREAILRELERGGQVYVVHNRVESINHVAQHVRQLVPHARVAVGHGQMNERQLEHAMMQFYSGEAHILVCTTIIENGLDIPNANTLIVTDADRLGLAQLYQLRGRVGRSNRQAYAYLMWTPYKRLTETAEKRIAAIREFSDLGSGFRIALRDLEIRGAGNLLGAEQHGFIASVGFELYMQMLSDAVQEAKGETPEPRPEVSVDLPVPAYLPEDYAPDRNQRIDLYRRLASAPDHVRLQAIADEIADRFGRPLPPTAQNLVRLAGAKILCARAGVQRVVMEGSLAVLLLREECRLSARLMRELRSSLAPETRIWLALTEHDRVVVSLRNAGGSAASATGDGAHEGQGELGSRTEQIFARLEPVLEALGKLPLQEEARRHQRRQELSARL